MSTVQDIEVQFAVPAMDVQTGTYGKIVLTAVLQTVPAETVIYNEELRQYIENIKLEISESVEKITQDLSVDVTGRLGYRFTVNSQAGSSYTLTLEDEGTLVRMTSSQENQVIIPDEATVPFEVGTIVNLRRSGIGETVVVPAPGVVVNTPDSTMKIDDKNLGVGLVKVGPDEWDLVKSFTGVPMSEVTQLIDDIEGAITAQDEAQTALDDRVSDINDTLASTIDTVNQTLTESVNSAIAKVEKAIEDLGNVATLSQFGSLKDDTGYQRLPGGLILQWGKTALLNKDEMVTVLLPVSFPNKALNAQATTNSTTTDDNDAIARVISFTSTNIRVRNEGANRKSSSSAVIHWFAVGY